MSALACCPSIIIYFRAIFASNGLRFFSLHCFSWSHRYLICASTIRAQPYPRLHKTPCPILLLRISCSSEYVTFQRHATWRTQEIHNDSNLSQATGSIGKHIFTALLSEPSFTITVLTRKTSSATFPSNIAIKRISDDFPLSELIPAFKGQDVVIVATSTVPLLQGDLSNRFVDAAVAAGVRRLIPSDFGPDVLDKVSREFVPVYKAKGENLEYLIKKAEESGGRLTWTSFATGSWLDW